MVARQRGAAVTEEMLSYPDAPRALIDRWQERRAPLRFGPGEALPPLEADLALLAATPLPLSRPEPSGPLSSFGQKRHALATELAGGTELQLLHALLISCLRKRAWPEQAPALFRRIWAEQSDILRDSLPTRWLISAAITFADHGADERQRRLGQSLNLLFSLMKLYEFERLHSGLAPDEAFRPGHRAKAPLPLDMPSFSLGSGGLDINLLAPIWAEAREDALLGPLACHLLEALNRDSGTLFRRLGTMRARLDRRRDKAARRNP